MEGSNAGPRHNKACLLVQLVTLLLLTAGCRAALPNCDATTQCSAVPNSLCEAAGQPCQCNPRFHPNADSTACVADIQPDGTCSDDIECVDDAACLSVTLEGQAGLKCTCNEGFHKQADAVTETDFCQADIRPGMVCAVNGSDVECVVNATCETQTTVNGTGLACECVKGFHPHPLSNATCVADIALGGTCLVDGGDEECEDKGQCKNTAEVNQTAILECFCRKGYHSKTIEGQETCEEDISPGQLCSQEASGKECVDHATCVSVQAAESETTELQCKCETRFHEEDNKGKLFCYKDTCTSTKEMCMPSDVPACEEVNSFLGCMIDGPCDSSDSSEVEVYAQAMNYARHQMPADCSIDTTPTTCKEELVLCLNTYLHPSQANCSSTGSLKSCLQNAESSCSSADAALTDAHATASNYIDSVHDNLSCPCLTSAESCKATAMADYGADEADNSAKCSAASALFSCALDNAECGDDREVEKQAKMALWSTAFAWAHDNSCKDTLTAESATSCSLQLTRCAFIYTDGRGEGQDQASNCKASAAFGDCLADDTDQCGAEDGEKKAIFTRELDASGATSCECLNHLSACSDSLGILSDNTEESCPKLLEWGHCLLRSPCGLVDTDKMTAAQNSYQQQMTQHACNVTSDGKCAGDLRMCVDSFLRKSSSTNDNHCSPVQDNVLCVNAANCTSAEELQEMTSSHSVTSGRLQILSCTALPCNASYQQLLKCKEDYETAFNLSGTDQIKLCEAKNGMVSCMQPLQCNHYMQELINFKYNALKNVPVEDCVLMPLSTGSNGAVGVHTSLALALFTLPALMLASWL